jgi:archaemetzincin
VKIILQPVAANLDYNALCLLAKDISQEFENIKVTIGTSSIEPRKDIDFQSAFDRRRNQWHSFKLLEWFLGKFNHVRGTKILGILDIDAYSSGFDFVFGEAFYRGSVAAVYLSRLNQEFYGLKPNSSLLYERMVKEAIHELGHAFGFVHCKNPRCVMHFSTSLPDIDTKERSFCYSCRKVHFR